MKWSVKDYFLKAGICHLATNVRTLSIQYSFWISSPKPWHVVTSTGPRRNQPCHRKLQGTRPNLRFDERTPAPRRPDRNSWGGGSRSIRRQAIPIRPAQQARQVEDDPSTSYQEQHRREGWRFLIDWFSFAFCFHFFFVIFVHHCLLKGGRLNSFVLAMNNDILKPSFSSPFSHLLCLQLGINVYRDLCLHHLK